jgi:hypothetical protein
MSVSSVIGWAKRVQTKTLHIFIGAVLGFNGLGLAAPMLVSHAAAATADDIVINEVAPATGSANKWVELYNTSADAFNLDDFRLVRGGNNFSTVIPTGTNIAGHGYYVVESTSSALPLDSAGSALELWTGPSSTGTEVDSVDWGTVAAGTSYGRTTDGAATWQVFTTPTKGAANTSSALSAEEFVTVDGSYKGISVGFNAKDFSDVTDVTVVMHRNAGGDAVKRGTADLFNLINSNTAPYKFTAPFVIQPGAYDPAFDSYWSSDSASWDATTVPSSVTITVTDSSGSKQVANSNFLQNDPSHPAYASLLPANPIPACGAPTNGNFENDSLGSVNGQHGWSSTGPYDQAVVNNTYGYDSFGCKSLRISNFVTSGAFGDQTFSYSAPNEAGETSAVSGGMSSGTRQNRYEASFDIASTSANQQNGLFMSVSPDRGDGARMSYLGFDDQADGVHVIFYDVQQSGPCTPSGCANFVSKDIKTLSRDQAHNVKFVIDFKDGPGNDVAQIFIDGTLVHTGTTWEDYYRYDPEQAGSSNEVPTVDSLLFKLGNPSAPATQGNGYLLDNVVVATSATPVTPPAPGGGKGGGDTTGGGNGGGVVLSNVTTTPSVSQSSYEAAQVLSDTTATPANTSEKAKTTESKTNNNDKSTSKNSSCSKLLGICWYWWIPIVLGVAAVIYWYLRSADTDTTTSGR